MSLDPDAISDQLGAAALGPQSVQSDAGTVQQQPLPDLIAAHRYAAAVTASGGKSRGLRFNKLRPEGANGSRGWLANSRFTLDPCTFNRVDMVTPDFDRVILG